VFGNSLGRRYRFGTDTASEVMGEIPSYFEKFHQAEVGVELLDRFFLIKSRPKTSSSSIQQSGFTRNTSCSISQQPDEVR